MKVMVLVKASSDSEAGVMPSTELLTAMGQYNQQLSEAGLLLAGEGLHPTSRAVRVKFSTPARTVTNGPFPLSQDLVSGFWIWQVTSIDEAIDWLKRAPFTGDTELEIRPIFSPEDFGAALTPELAQQEQSLRDQL